MVFLASKRQLCSALLAFIFVLTTPITAKSALRTEQVKVKIIKIASIVASPNSCTLAPLEEVCEMTFHLLWQTPSKGDYCLYMEDEFDKPIQCWKKANRASVQLAYFAHILESSKSYLLIDNKQNTIAIVSVPVTGTLKQRQRAQRRRRGFWRMF